MPSDLNAHSDHAIHKVRIWDLPTRIFHWALAFSVIALIITGNVGGAAMPWHFRLGYLVMTLLMFRVVWGFVGGYWSRFSSFIYAPKTMLLYLKGQGKPEHSAGHNPLGSGSVFALIFILGAQVLSGLVSDDEITNQGPLSKFVSAAKVSLGTWWHKEIGKKIILALVILHVLAILFYYFKKRENLISPMIGGDKEMNHPVPAAQDSRSQRIAALVIFILCAGFTYWVQSLGA